jgi:hypothetical protein
MAPIAEPNNVVATAAAPTASIVSPPSLLTLLTSLPRDLLRTLLSQNCSGKTLSTLRLSLLVPLLVGQKPSTVCHGKPNEEASLSSLVELISFILEDRLRNFDSSSSSLSSSLSSLSIPSNEDKYLSQVQSCIRHCQWEKYAAFTRITSTSSRDESHNEKDKSAASQPHQVQQQQQHTSGRLPSFSWKIPALIDYLEQPAISHAVWCGRLEFPSFVFQNNAVVPWDHAVAARGEGGGEMCHAKVILQATPASWTTKALREWYAVTLAAASFASASTKSISASFDSASSSQKNPPQPTLLPSQEDYSTRNEKQTQPQKQQPPSCFRLSRPQPYNFVPIPPYGRILAQNVASQQVLARISDYLEQGNLVLTLPATSATTIVTTTTAMTCSGRRRTRQRRRTLVVRIISPRQAQCRMKERFGSTSSSFRPMDWDQLVSPTFTADVSTTSTATTEGLICSWEYDGDDDDEEDTHGTCGDNEVSIQNDITNGNLAMEAILEILCNYHNPYYYGATCKTSH